MVRRGDRRADARRHGRPRCGSGNAQSFSHGWELPARLTGGAEAGHPGRRALQARLRRAADRLRPQPGPGRRRGRPAAAASGSTRSTCAGPATPSCHSEYRQHPSCPPCSPVSHQVVTGRHRRPPALTTRPVPVLLILANLVHGRSVDRRKGWQVGRGGSVDGANDTLARCDVPIPIRSGSPHVAVATSFRARSCVGGRRWARVVASRRRRAGRRRGAACRRRSSACAGGSPSRSRTARMAPPGLAGHDPKPYHLAPGSRWDALYLDLSACRQRHRWIASPLA